MADEQFALKNKNEGKEKSEMQNVSKEKIETKTESKLVETSKKEDKKLEVKKEEKVELEREYVVPLKRKVLVSVHYKRAKKAVLVLKQFLAKHMHVENRDVRLVKVDKYLNQELWYRGIKKPLNSVKVKAKKINGVVYVELAELPPYVKFQKQKDENRVNKVIKTNITHDKKNDHKEEKATQEASDSLSQEEKEKEARNANREEGIKENKAQAKAQKHTTGTSHAKNTTPRRQVLQK